MPAKEYRPPERLKNSGSGMKIPDEQWDKFIEAMKITGNVARACGAANISRSSQFKRRQKDPEFAARFEEAKEVAYDRLEEHAWTLGVEGIEEPIFSRGEVVGTKLKYEPKMVEMLLRANRPDKFGNKQDIHLKGEVNIADAMAAAKAKLASLAESGEVEGDEE